MNLPNKLTVMRIFLTPLFMAAMLISFPHHYGVALLIFIVAAITDYFDGKIARERKIVTNFGKFLDPLADKMLTTAAFLAFLAVGHGEGIAWVLFIVLFREFMIASLRLVAVSSEIKKVIPANIWGKIKTVTQMIAVICGIVVLYLSESIGPLLPVDVALVLRDVLYVVYNVILWVSTAFTIISGVIYTKDSFEFINPSK